MKEGSEKFRRLAHGFIYHIEVKRGTSCALSTGEGGLETKKAARGNNHSALECESVVYSHECTVTSLFPALGVPVGLMIRPLDLSKLKTSLRQPARRLLRDNI